jgi:hypothetical protein
MRCSSMHDKRETGGLAGEERAEPGPCEQKTEAKRVRTADRACAG